MKKSREVVNQIYTACRYIVEMSVNVVKESMWNMLRAQYAGLDVPMSVLLYIYTRRSDYMCADLGSRFDSTTSFFAVTVVISSSGAQAATRRSLDHWCLK